MLQIGKDNGQLDSLHNTPEPVSNDVGQEGKIASGQRVKKLWGTKPAIPTVTTELETKPRDTGQSGKSIAWKFRWNPELAETLLKQAIVNKMQEMTLADYLNYCKSEQASLVYGRKKATIYLSSQEQVQGKLKALNNKLLKTRNTSEQSTDVTSQNLVVDFAAMSLQLSKINEEVSESVILPPKNEQLRTDPLKQNTPLTKAYKKNVAHRQQENRLMAGATTAAVVSGGSVALASAARPGTDPGMFDHILQKDTPLNQMIILSQHNAGALAGKGTLPLIASNQTMTIEETLDKTPVRGFGLDLHIKNGDVVINHGGIFDPTVSHDDITKLDDVLQSMNQWLDHPDNQDEVVFLNFDNPNHLPDNILEEVFGEDTVMGSPEYNHLYNQLGRAPTINEIRAQGYEVAFLDHSRYREAGRGETGFRGHPIDSIWEDRTLLEHGKDLGMEFGEFTTDDIAEHLTTTDIDWLIQSALQSGKGAFVSLDKISSNDPRFFKPEDRDSLLLKPDLKLMGLFYESDESLQNALLGLGSTLAAATTTLALAGGAYQGFLNEQKIRDQDKLLPKHLKTMELSGVLQKRKYSKTKTNKSLSQEVTVEEVINLYKTNQLKAITKDTVLAGGGSTVSLTGSTLALGMLFPPLFPAFAGASVGVAGAGSTATILATVGNRHRLNKAIDQAFELPEIKKALEQRVQIMNRELKNAEGRSENIDQFLSNMVVEREQAERLLTASTAMLSASLIARASGMAKYGLPAIGTAAMGVGASITGVLVALSAIMNYRERRSKLTSLAQTSSEVLRPDYGRKQKRKLCLFGNTAFERFLNNNREMVLTDLDLPLDTSNKRISQHFSLPGNEIKLEKYLRFFAEKEWKKDLAEFANRQKPGVEFNAIRESPELLQPFLKQYLIHQVADFAHNDTWNEGRSGTLKLALIGAFSGIFFLPMLAVSAATLGIGLGISKGVAVHERNLFKRQLEKLIDTLPENDPEKKAVHDSLHRMINSWTRMLTSTDNGRDTPLIL